MKSALNKRLTEIENSVGLGSASKVYICRPADSSEDGKEHWKDFTGEIKKPKKFNFGDKVIVDDIKGELNSKNNNQEEAACQNRR